MTRSAPPSLGWLATSIVLASSLCVALRAEAPSPSEPIRDLGLVESAKARLVQIDVSVSGTADVCRSLARRDFELQIGNREINDFTVDSSCVGSEQPLESSGNAPGAVGSEAPEPVSKATFMFYFDQNHLTLAGRQRAIALCRELIPKLIGGGSCGMIVSNAKALSVYAQLTSDREALLTAVTRLEGDAQQWSEYATLEPDRVIDVLEELDRDGTRARVLARRYEQDEVWQANRDLKRLSMLLGMFASFDPPKVVLAFVDTLRSNAGEHYLYMFGRDALQRGNTLTAPNAIEQAMAADAFGAAFAFDQVVREANAFGVRFYPVQAEGLVGLYAGGIASARWSGSVPPDSKLPLGRVEDSERSLQSLAAETGGRAFIRGVSGARMVSGIRADLACMAILSFDPGDLPRDRPLSVMVSTRRPRVRSHYRSTIVVPSDAARTTARLLAAFAGPSDVKSGTDVKVNVVPTGYADGQFKGLVQLSAREAGPSDGTWEMGASLVSRTAVRDEVAARLSTTGAHAPVVLEGEWSFPPGPFEIAAVTRNLGTDEVVSRRMEGAFPDPSIAPTVAGPIVVLQPAHAAFSRNGRARSWGAIVRDETEELSASLPTVLVSLVCRGPRESAGLSVERALGGNSTNAFPRIDLSSTKEACVQVRDVVPAGTLSAGVFQYEVTITEGTTPRSHQQRTLRISAAK